MRYLDKVKENKEKLKKVKEETMQIYNKLHRNRPMTSSPSNEEIKDYNNTYKKVKEVRMPKKTVKKNKNFFPFIKP